MKHTMRAMILILAVLLLLAAGGCKSTPGGRTASREEGAGGMSGMEPAPAGLPDRGALTDFQYVHGYGDQGAVSYSLIREDTGDYSLSLREDGPIGSRHLDRLPVSPAAVDELVALLERHDIAAWDGFSEEIEAADGAGFFLSVRFESGLSIKADGYEVWPDNFREASGAMLDFLEALAEEADPVPGVPVLSRSDHIILFSYGYGSYHGGYWEFHLRREDDRVLLSALGYNGVDLNVFEQPVPAEVLDELQILLADQGILDWNGFSESDESMLDGYGFSLHAEYEGEGTLLVSGYMMEPPNYEQAHAALSAYLRDLAEPFHEAESPVSN